MTRTRLSVDDSVKMLRETFCVAQGYVLRSTDSRAREHGDRLERLIAECDRLRPLGPDGKHGNRHTRRCGCAGRRRRLFRRWAAA